MKRSAEDDATPAIPPPAKRTTGSTLENLPLDVLAHVLTFVDVDSVVLFSQINPFYRDLLTGTTCVLGNPCRYLQGWVQQVLFGPLRCPDCEENISCLQRDLPAEYVPVEYERQVAFLVARTLMEEYRIGIEMQRSRGRKLLRHEHIIENLSDQLYTERNINKMKQKRALKLIVRWQLSVLYDHVASYVRQETDVFGERYVNGDFFQTIHEYSLREYETFCQAGRLDDKLLRDTDATMCLEKVGTGREPFNHHGLGFLRRCVERYGFEGGFAHHARNAYLSVPILIQASDFWNDKDVENVRTLISKNQASAQRSIELNLCDYMLYHDMDDGRLASVIKMCYPNPNAMLRGILLGRIKSDDMNRSCLTIQRHNIDRAFRCLYDMTATTNDGWNRYDIALCLEAIGTIARTRIRIPKAERIESIHRLVELFRHMHARGAFDSRPVDLKDPFLDSIITSDQPTEETIGKVLLKRK